MEHPYELKEHYGSAVLSAVIAIAGRQEGEDVCSQFWLDVFTGALPTTATTTQESLVGSAVSRARKAANRRQKDGIRMKTYTEEPTHPPQPGEISSEQLEELCRGVMEDRSASEERLTLLKSIFSQLLIADQAFLLLYQTHTAKYLIPKYGASEVAVRQRAFRLKGILRARQNK
jgi:hypothetical protein